MLCRHENFAQSWPGTHGLEAGAVTENAELQTFGASEWSTSPLQDLKSQIHQWAAKEDGVMQGLSERERLTRANNTIHVISFGFWDIWHLIGEDLEKAKSSVDRSIATLFDQLHALADKWDPVELKTILTLTSDLTFHPGFSPTADNHKKTIALVEHWNTQLRDTAEEWERGTIFLYDTNSFMLDQIRDRQLYVAGLVDEMDPTDNNSTDWHDVTSACVKKNGTASTPSDEKAEPCPNPEQFLFW